MSVFPKIYQPHENTEAELWFRHINCNCRGHRQSSEALSADNLHGCKSTDRKHPQKRKKYRGVPVNSFIEATARLREKQEDETEAERQRGKMERGWGGRAEVCIDLTCLSHRPVEPVNSTVPEVPIVAQISDNDLCVAMIVGDRYWQAGRPVSWGANNWSVC